MAGVPKAFIKILVNYVVLTGKLQRERKSHLTTTARRNTNTSTSISTNTRKTITRRRRTGKERRERALRNISTRNTRSTRKELTRRMRGRAEQKPRRLNLIGKTAVKKMWRQWRKERYLQLPEVRREGGERGRAEIKRRKMRGRIRKRREKGEGSIPPRLHHVVRVTEVERGDIDLGLPPLLFLTVQIEKAQDHHHLLLHQCTGGEGRVVQMIEENALLFLSPLPLEEDNRVVHHLLELGVESRGLRQQAQNVHPGHPRPRLGIRPIRGVDRGVQDRDVGLGQSPGAQ